MYFLELTLKNSVFSAIYLRLPGVRGGLITTATLPWFGLKGCAGSTLLMFSPVTMATDWVSPTRSITSEIAALCTLQSLAWLQAVISVWSHSGGCTCSQSETKAGSQHGPSHWTFHAHSIFQINFKTQNTKHFYQITLGLARWTKPWFLT